MPEGNAAKSAQAKQVLDGMKDSSRSSYGRTTLTPCTS